MFGDKQGCGKKVEHLYFQSEAEAQAWEDSCTQLEAPAPTQFLQNVAKAKVSPTEHAAVSQTSAINSSKAAKQVKQTKVSTCNAALSGSNATDAAQPSFKMKFKTEICKFWQLHGTCEYSDACSFAHGSHELKQRTDMPRNYKTKQCKRFHKELYCPYGHRCQFLHDEPRQKTSKK